MVFFLVCFAILGLMVGVAYLVVYFECIKTYISKIWKYIRHRLKQKGYEYKLTIFKVILTLVVCTIIFLLDYVNVLKTFMTDYDMISDVVSTILALYLIFVLLQPRFSISPTLVLAGNNRLRVNVRTRLYFISLHDIVIEMKFMRYDKQMDDNVLRTINLDRDEVTNIPGRLWGRRSSFYTCYTKDAFIWPLESRFDTIRCRVTATNSLSGIKRTKEITFYREDVVYGEFVNGEVEAFSQRYEENEKVLRQYQQIRSITETLLLPICKQISFEQRKNYNKCALQYLKDLNNESFLNTYGDYSDVFKSITESLEILKGFNEKTLSPKNKKTFQKQETNLMEMVMFLSKQMSTKIKEQNDI